MGEALFLGVDGGASRCRARLRDAAGALLGEGRAGPANVAADIAQARASILEAASGALRAAGLPASALARCRAGLGLAGAGRAEARLRLLDGWAPFAAVQAESDAHVAWLGAHGGEDGAVVILGTGSVAYGRAGAARHVLGGWGPEISDEAGAAAIGRDALRRSLWAWDGRLAMSPLAETLLAMFGGSPVGLVAAARAAGPADFGAYAPLVFQFAEQGDGLAAAILRDAAGHAARMLGRLRDLGYGRIALMGGVAAPMTPWLPEVLRGQLSPARHDATEGAVMLARQGPG